MGGIAFNPLMPNRTAVKAGIIDVPLFDPPYQVPATVNWGFDFSSPWPFLTDGVAGSIVGINMRVLTPFEMASLTMGNMAGATAKGFGASFYGAKAKYALGEPGPITDGILVPGGLSTSIPFVKQYNWNLPLGFGGVPYGGPVLFWHNSQLYFGFYSIDPGSGGFGAGSLVGAPFFADAPALGWEGFNSPGFAGSQVGIVGSFFLGAVANAGLTFTDTYVTTTNPINGVTNHLFELFLNPSIFSTEGFAVSMVFDDPNLNSLNITRWSGTEYGLLGTWEGTFNPIPNQQVQALLLTFDPANLNNTMRYAYLRWQPQTAAAQALMNLPNATYSLKIDPNGVFYFYGGNALTPPGFPAGTYVANSAGLDISLPGVTVPVLPPSGLSSFCPCSPVAVPVAG